MPPNDRGYGHWRFARAFAVVERQSECGSKTAGMHVSQPMSHRRVLAAVVCFSFCRSNFSRLVSFHSLTDFFSVNRQSCYKLTDNFKLFRRKFYVSQQFLKSKKWICLFSCRKVIKQLKAWISSRVSAFKCHFCFLFVAVKMQKVVGNEQNQSRIFFLVSILSTTRNGFSLFSSCQREFILFFSCFSVLSKCDFSPKTSKFTQFQSRFS